MSRGLLGDRGVRPLWAAAACLSAAFWMLQISVALHVLAVAGTAALATVQLAGVLPALLLSPVAGLAADRMRLRPLLLWTVTAQAAAVTGMAARLRRPAHLPVWAVSYMAQGLAWAGFFAAPSLPAALGCLAVMRLASGLIIALDTTILLETVPAEFRGPRDHLQRHSPPLPGSTRHGPRLVHPHLAGHHRRTSGDRNRRNLVAPRRQTLPSGVPHIGPASVVARQVIRLYVACTRGHL